MKIYSALAISRQFRYFSTHRLGVTYQLPKLLSRVRVPYVALLAADCAGPSQWFDIARAVRMRLLRLEGP